MTAPFLATDGYLCKQGLVADSNFSCTVPLDAGFLLPLELTLPLSEFWWHSGHLGISSWGGQLCAGNVTVDDRTGTEQREDTG